MNRSAGVTVIAVLALVGSAGAMGLGALTLVGLLVGSGATAPKDFPGSPTFFRAMMLLVPLVYVLPAVWGIVSGVGLLQRKNWARISTIVFSTLLIAFGVFTGFGSLIFFLNAPPPTMEREVAVFVRVFMVALATAEIGIGVWWLVFLNRARVREEFVGPRFNALATAGYPMQPSYHVQPPPAAMAPVPIAPKGPTRPLSISIIAWILLASSILLPINLILHAPASLFVWILTGWQADALFLVVVALLIYIGVGLLRLNPYARLAGIGYFAFALANSAVFFFAPGARARMMRAVELQHSMFPWMRDLPKASYQIDPMPFLLMGAVMGLAFCLVPLYFLITNKKAFERSPAA